MGWFSRDPMPEPRVRRPVPMENHLYEPSVTERIFLFKEKHRAKEKASEPEQPTVKIDEELKELVRSINAGGKLYFLRKDGSITDDPWLVKLIVPQTGTDTTSREETRFDIVLYPTSNPDALEVYELGDFFANRWVPPNEKEKLARQYYRGELPSYEEFRRLVDALEPEGEPMTTH